MSLSEDKIFEKMENFVDVALETFFFHMNTILLAFHVDIT